MPALLDAGRANLDGTLARPLVETAISDGRGAADFWGAELADAVKSIAEEPLQGEFRAANGAAIAAMRAFVDWLENERLPKATSDFGIGREAFARMLRGNELIPQSPEEVLEAGLRELKAEQERFAAAARAIDPSKKPIDVFKAIQRDHPTPQGLIPDTRKNLESIRKFLVDHDLITLPSEVRARVEETPKFARATTFASMDTPGPFETNGTEAYYYVTPTEAEWTAEKKEEWLTAFNYYTTDVVSIHEAYPGHYVQYLHLNASQVDRVAKIFGSYAFIEGWAHYTEEMMLDEGFGAGDSAKAARYRLAQSDEALLRICRLIVSIRMHCQGMTQEEATRFFVENCYYEESPSKAEALRGASDPGYLFYTVGKMQFRKLRADWKKQEAAQFSLKRFHDAVLSHGAPPLRLLREIMLRDPESWDRTL